MGSDMKLQIWDAAGHEDLGRFRQIAYAETDCFLICFDLTQRHSLANACQKWLKEVKQTAKTTPCILVGTKHDVWVKQKKPGVTNAEIEAEARKYGFQGFIICCAKER